MLPVDLAAYLPTAANALCFAGVVVTAMLMASVGGLAAGRSTPPETRMVVGWGVMCIAFTLWGVMTPSPLSLPAAALGAAGLVAYKWREPVDGVVLRFILLSLPLVLVVLPMRPSQVDTWLNLLPNAAYLVDHGMLPTDARPPSYSFLPGAPYNTQFVAFAASLLVGRLCDNAMGLFNVLLLLGASALLARALVGSERNDDAGHLSWGACAGGFLLALPLNPGLVPRAYFAPYGEAPLAVTTLFAVWVGTNLIQNAARRLDVRAEALSLSLILAALVNIKQSGPGLLAALLAGLLGIGLLHPQMPRRKWLGVIASVGLPAILLYLIWHEFVARSFAGGGELKMLPLAQWHFDLIPQILAAILVQILKRITYFILLAAVLVAAAIEMRRDPWSKAGIALGLCASLIVLFNGFLIFMYVGHFPADWSLDAHSYFRYMSQLSLAAILGLILWLRTGAMQFLARQSVSRRRKIAGVSVAAALLSPLLFLPFIRIDLEPPQPTLWKIGKEAEAFLHRGDKLGLIVPGDTDDIAGSMMRGLIMFTPPRVHPLDIRTATSAKRATLAAMATDGYRLALVTCTPGGLAEGVPAKVAAMLAFKGGIWRRLAIWHYPPDLPRHHWAGLLPRSAFCGDSQPGQASKPVPRR